VVRDSARQLVLAVLEDIMASNDIKGILEDRPEWHQAVVGTGILTTEEDDN